MAYDAKAPERAPKLRFTDDDFLAMVRAERAQSIGMDNGDDLAGDREQALNYLKGDMSDLPHMPNRSGAVHTVVSDTIGQAMPDLVEIFLGGEDIGAFKPVGEEDEEAAKQETESVNNVITNDNDGFGLIHDYVHDALSMKTGVFHAWLLREEKYEEETLRGQTAMAVEALQTDPGTEVLQVIPAGEDQMVGALFDVEVGRTRQNACVKIAAVPPEDFAVGRDTTNLRDATYAVMRQRPRAQKLKEMGFDADIVDALPAFGGAADNQLDQARDMAGEHDEPIGASDAINDLRTVLIYVHVIRVDADGDGATELWRVITDERESVLIDKEKLEVMPFAAGTPYRQPHRFYGRSLADLCIELQRIMTALLRMHLDGGYFALNARHEINVQQATEHTLSDYLNNTPGFPVRSRGNALTPLVSTKSDFNALDSLEYMATVGETRTGVTRNAQGLNPDTLHDTAKGAQALMTNAQKRLRMIARVLAETGLKDLFLIVHTLLRTSGMDRPMAQRLRGKWVQVDPTKWGERKDFTVEIGMGAGGREMDLQAGMMLGNMINQLVAAQASGAISPPIATAKNVYSFVDWQRERLGIKRTTFFTDPESPEGQQLAQQAAQPKPDPAMAKVQADTQAKQAELQLRTQESQATQQLKTQEAQANLALQDKKDTATLEAQREKAQLDLQLAREKAAAEIALAQNKASAEIELAWAKFEAEQELARSQQAAEQQLAREQLAAQREMHSEKTDAAYQMHGEKVEADVEMKKNRAGGKLDE